MAEINRIQYELDYTKGIRQRMHVPNMLKVAPQAHDGPLTLGPQDVYPSAIMQVPDRILASGDNGKKIFPETRDLDLIHSTPFDTLLLKSPGVLTLGDRPLDFLEDEQQAAHDTDDTIRPQGRMRREREASFDAGVEDLAMVDAASLRRKLIKLNRRLQLLEEENKERVKREMILYSITVAFWLVNTWVWLRH